MRDLLEYFKTPVPHQLMMSTMMAGGVALGVRLPHACISRRVRGYFLMLHHCHVCFLGLASSTLGAVMHELLHTFGLPHVPDRLDVMSRGFDYLNRRYTFLESNSDYLLHRKDSLSFSIFSFSRPFISFYGALYLKRRTFHPKQKIVPSFFPPLPFTLSSPHFGSIYCVRI